ncbi:MAG: hypothetical protein JXN65_01195 [Clostridia bacterium]|nr:hypothetical protein [Clostridia bacterium]
MIKKLFAIAILCVMLLFSGCEIIMQPAQTAVPATAAPNPQDSPAETQADNATQPPAATEAPTDTPPPAATATPEPTPYNTMDFFTCYAHMVSYNPSNSWAEFDYFYLHQGQDAIDYLVEHEGYSQADAEALVNGFADSEFVEENNNPGIRTIDLDTVDVRIIINMDGSVGPDLIGSITTMAHFNDLYAANHSYILDYFFYEVECDTAGNVLEVKQIYWP